MRWMICWNEEAGWGTDHLARIEDVASSVAGAAGKPAGGNPYRSRVRIWMDQAQLGDVLEFPLGIVVRTSEHATEIDYEETDR